MIDDLMPLSFDAGPLPVEVVQVEPAEPWRKAGPRLLADLSGEAAVPDLRNGPRHTLPRRLERMRGVHLLWSNFFIADGRCWTIYDEDPRRAVAGIVDWPGLSAVSNVSRHGDGFCVSRALLRDAERVAGPVLVASSNEPHNWGMWLLYVLPAVVHFVEHRASYDRLLVYADHPNMGRMLALLGLSDRDVIRHDCSRAYHLADAHVFRQECRDFAVTAAMRAAFAQVRRHVTLPSPMGKRLYAGRRRRSEANAYRALVNEAALAAALQRLGYAEIDPELLPADEQIACFAGAGHVVALGGAGAFNTVFCDPGARLIDIESTADHLSNHSDIFASTGLDYGLIIGRVDAEDPALHNKRWTIDVTGTTALV